MKKKHKYISIPLILFLLLTFNLPAQLKPTPSTTQTYKDLRQSKRYLEEAVDDLNKLLRIYQVMDFQLKNALLEKQKTDKIQLKSEREANFEQSIRECAQALVLIAMRVSRTEYIALGPHNRNEIHEPKVYRSFQSKIKGVLKKSLAQKIELYKLMKGLKIYPYTTNMQRKISDLLKALGKVIRNGSHAIKAATDMISKIKERIKYRRYIGKR